MKPILVINSGSSSLKYQLIDLDSEDAIAAGLIERVTSHEDAFAQMLSELTGPAPLAIGHRVVHGGSSFADPTLITDSVLSQIESLASLAPLHNPANAAGIRAARKSFPEVAQVAVFDTAFHQSMPASSFRYAISSELEEKYAIRKYGFHGSSFSYVSRQAAKHLAIEPERFNAVILHLGNGASACAIKNGKSFDTSMGLTPLPGLVMGSRSGDVDPAIVSYLVRVGGMNIDQVDESLNSASGLKGMTGHSDMRDVQKSALSGDAKAKEALEVYSQRIRHYIGAYLAEVGPIQAVVFTGGVGENSQMIRQLTLRNLDHLGLQVDLTLNQSELSGARTISKANSPIAILVIPTNEELEIALQTQSVLASLG